MSNPNQNPRAQLAPVPAIPDALEPTTDPQVPELRLGEPFAISYGCDLVDAKGSGGAGCHAIVKCDCGQMFRIDLLNGEKKWCPQCRTEFTHALLVAPADDTEIVSAAMTVVMQANGMEGPGEEEEDDEGEGDEGDGDGDDEPAYENGEDERG